MLCRYDAGEAEAVSEADAEEYEFSDDEKEAAWRREQKALQPAKRKAQDAPRGRSGARGGRHNGRHSTGSADPGPGLPEQALQCHFPSPCYTCRTVVQEGVKG